MALIKCNECGKEISDMANICPHCGYNIRKEKLNRKKHSIKNKVKKQIPNAKRLITIIIIIIGFFLLLENIIDFIGEKIAEKKWLKPALKKNYLVILPKLSDQFVKIAKNY